MTPEGARLLESYRQAQVRLATESARSAIAIWPFLARGDQTTWLSLVLALIRRDRGLSGGLARQYMAAYRLLEGVEGEFRPETPEINEEQVISSMLFMGPAALDKARRRAFPDEDQSPGQTSMPMPISAGIARKIMESNARAVQRHVLNGGRDTVDDVLLRDPARKGYMRLTDGDPCFFCAMLASRGPVYEEESFDDSDPRFTGAGEHKVHDGCACTLVPIYGSGLVPLTQFKKYEKLWAQTTKSGAAAIKEFRQMYEGREVR